MRSAKNRTEHLDPNDIIWERSSIQIPSRDISFHTDARLPISLVVEAPLYIVRPDELLAKVLNMPTLSSPEDIQKYLDAKRNIWLEIIAATWRLLAINKPDVTERGFQANLIKQIRHYMHLHGLADADENGFSEDTMEAVVRNILIQWREKETNASVRVSSVANRVPSSRSKG